MQRLIARLMVLLIAIWLLPTASQASPSVPPTRFIDQPWQKLYYTNLVWETSGQCAGMFRVQTTNLCTHGPDPIEPQQPQSWDDEFINPNNKIHVSMAQSSQPCLDDSTNHYRTQVLYVRASDTQDNSSIIAPVLRKQLVGVDSIYNQSAQLTGGQRHIRWQLDQACQIDVQHVVIAPSADNDFGSTIAAVAAQGFNRADRKYLMFVEARYYCGIATVQHDTQASSANTNNHTVAYARIDAGCWNARVVAHEHMHMIGGVQPNAPNTSSSWHCTDEWDIMCYSDAPSYPQLVIACPEHSIRDIFDCGHDDYFHTNPPAQSYLASHWNSANSLFLSQQSQFWQVYLPVAVH
ncbi:hypothetical protein [Herpetosiphon giganteus]|uniref:hypothetical protein n=1 Tax=Herpetosiphon giganteus TaxID=2029754 RepID=UPI00195734B8|nr:hypothetical protein [Herpetosiphon giganteus]MBM7841519.1 hypothetical protein [Herpetosiphon giganteus]